MNRWLIVLLLCPPAWGTACNLASSNGIACVQRVQSTAGGTPNSIAYASNNTAGNMSIVIVRVSGGNSNIPTDTRNTYQVATDGTNSLQNIPWGAGSTLSIYFAPNIGAGANTVSETFSAGTAQIFCFEISGLATSSPVDKSAKANATSTTPASGATATTTQSIELAVGAEANPSGGTAAAGSGWTLEATSGTSTFESELQILTATGTPNATWGAITSSAWGSGIATFKAASAAAAPTQSGAIILQ